QSGLDRARARRRSLLSRMLAAHGVLRGLLARRCRLSFAGRREANPGATRFRQSNRDRLFGVTRAMLAFAHMMHLFAHEFTGLRGGRLAFALVLARSLHCLFLGHVSLLEESDYGIFRKMRADRTRPQGAHAGVSPTAWRKSRSPVRRAMRAGNLCNPRRVAAC